jgi:transcriptional regulator with XRE-family HTH domain
VGGDLFAEWLDLTLANSGISARDLANQIGVSDSAVSRWRSGQSKPGMDTAVRLATVLDVDPIRLAVTAGLMDGRAVHVDPLPLPPAHAQRERVREQIKNIKGLSAEGVALLLDAYERELGSNGA